MITVKPTGKPNIDWFVFRNDNGMEFTVTNYGATLTSIKTPDRNGNIDEVSLGFDTIDAYLAGHPYFGSTIGRYGNRIGKGVFSLNGKTYHLTQNAGGHHLHGGAEGFDKKIWSAEVQEGSDAVLFRYASPDGEEGYPAAVQASVRFQLTEQNEVVIQYEATADGDTIINMTNHAYFNLDYKADTILDHLMSVSSDQIIEADADLIATGRRLQVAGTPFDFQKRRRIGEEIHSATNEMVRSVNGYDVSFIIKDNHQPGQTPIAEVYAPSTGRRLQVMTDQPGVHFYSAQQLDGQNITGHNGKAYPAYGAFCLETHHFPGSPNFPDFPSVVLKKGEVYKTETKYAFSVE